MLCKTFARVEIAGKRGRTVPIMFTPCIQRSIHFLMKTRKDVGVHDNNHYLFPRSSFGSLFPIRSSKSWENKRISPLENVLCKTENKTNTKLRKYVATVSQILNLEENELWKNSWDMTLTFIVLSIDYQSRRLKWWKCGNYCWRSIRE